MCFVSFYPMRSLFYFPDDSLEVLILTQNAQGIQDNYQAVNLLTDEVTERTGALELDKEELYQLKKPS